MENGKALSCVLLDVDDFKAYNDGHGHDAGDEILRCVARIMRESARADDLVTRYGEGEDHYNRHIRCASSSRTVVIADCGGSTPARAG